MAGTSGISRSVDAVLDSRALVHRRRRISPEAGRSLELLGHAIEYLTDEFVSRGCELSAASGEVQAIQLLMARNRQVYFACPEVPTIGERIRAILHPHFP